MELPPWLRFHEVQWGGCAVEVTKSLMCDGVGFLWCGKVDLSLRFAPHVKTAGRDRVLCGGRGSPRRGPVASLMGGLLGELNPAAAHKEREARQQLWLISHEATIAHVSCCGIEMGKNLTVWNRLASSEENSSH